MSAPDQKGLRWLITGTPYTTEAILALVRNQLEAAALIAEEADTNWDAARKIRELKS